MIAEGVFVLTPTLAEALVEGTFAEVLVEGAFAESVFMPMLAGVLVEGHEGKANYFF